MKTIIYAIICLTACLLYFPIFALCWIFTAPFEKNKKTLSKYTRVFGKLIIYSSPWWKVKVNGVENIDPNKQYIIMVNHQSMLDIPLTTFIKKNMKWVAKQEVLQIPLVNFIIMMRKDILIKRGTLTDSKRMIKKCRKELKKGVSIVIFPEGTRSKDGKIHSFKEGAFVVAKLGNVDILPVVLDGPFETAHPKSGFGYKFPSSFTINILNPISFESIKDEQVKDVKDMVRNTMVSYHKAIRKDLYL